MVGNRETDTQTGGHGLGSTAKFAAVAYDFANKNCRREGHAIGEKKRWRYRLG